VARPARTGPTVRLGVADHLGWAVVVSATSDLVVIERRRIELVEAGLPAAPVHHEGGPHEMHRTGDPLSDDELATLVGRVRASAASTIAREFDRLASEVPGTIASVSLRSWPPEFPANVADQRRAPHESQADPIMYRQELAAAAARRGWAVARYDARSVEGEARGILGDTGTDPLQHPRTVLGTPWTKDHRIAFAAVIVAERSTSSHP